MDDQLPPRWAHQENAFKKAALLELEGISSFAEFFDPGTGKTRTTIDILRHRMNAEKRVFRTLILCPPIVIKNWKDEWHKYSKIAFDKVILLTGSGRDRIAKILKYGWQDGKAVGRIFVTNYEALLMNDLFEELKRWAPEAVIADESHKIKDLTAKRTKRLVELGSDEWSYRKNNGKQEKTLKRPAPRHKFILTGTPVLNSPMDIFSQFLFLDGGRTFGQNFYAFRATYFRDLNAGMPKAKYFPDWQPIPERLDDMAAKIAKVAMSAKKSECLDLPPFVVKRLGVGMTVKQAKMYQEMKNDFLTFMETAGQDPSPVVAQLAITKALRLMQITSGFARDVEGTDHPLADTPKLEALKELLEDLTPHHKVIVWAVWRENYEQIRSLCESLGVRYVEVTGDTPAGKRFENVEAFNTDPGVRVFIGHPGSGGIGINLVASDISIFYSRTFSLEHSLQAEARNYRGGSERHTSVTRIDLVCENTIDELVQEKLGEKIEIGRAVLKDLASELKKE